MLAAFVDGAEVTTWTAVSSLLNWLRNGGDADGVVPNRNAADAYFGRRAAVAAQSALRPVVTLGESVYCTDRPKYRSSQVKTSRKPSARGGEP